MARSIQGIVCLLPSYLCSCVKLPLGTDWESILSRYMAIRGDKITTFPSRFMSPQCSCPTIQNWYVQTFNQPNSSPLPYNLLHLFFFATSERTYSISYFSSPFQVFFLRKNPPRLAPTSFFPHFCVCARRPLKLDWIPCLFVNIIILCHGKNLLCRNGGSGGCGGTLCWW